MPICSKKFDDVREIQKHLKSKNVTFASEIKSSDSGPASFVVLNPDGNAILIDQHI